MRGYEVVFANSQKALVVSALSSWVAQRPLIWNLHDILTADHFSALNRKVAVALANRFARRVIVNSEATLRAFHEAGGAVEKGTVVYNGIDIAPFDSVRAEEVKALRRELGVGEVPVVGVFSRLAPWKGQHVLIEALPQLPGVHALFVGSALFGEDAYEDELHRLVEGMGVSDRAHFLGFRREVPLLMACCDVVAHTSIAPEPFGRVIIEAMAAGRPVVATQAGGALEIITDRETGRLVAPGDPTALATAVQAVLCEPEKGKLVRAANDHVRETFSVAVMVETATQVIASVG
jgi:glycosyltransferase involved in cell wall biosynthesis